MQRVSERDLAYRDGDSGVKYMLRGPNLDWGVILLLPGQSLGGHYHQQVEETFYVASGEGLFTINGEEYLARQGDAFRMEATDRHDIRNEGHLPLKLLFIKYPYLPKDKVKA